MKPDLVEEDFEALVGTKVFPNRPIAEKISRYAGISWEAVTKKWRARARDTVLKRDVYLGVFTEELEAALAIKNYVEFGKLHPLQRPGRRKEYREREGDGGVRNVPDARKPRKRENEKKKTTKTKKKSNVRVAVARKPTTSRVPRGSGRAPRGPRPKGPSKQSQAVGRAHPKYGLVGRGHPKYRGVNILPTTAKGERLWRARICVDGQLTHLGAFPTAKCAAAAYNDAARRLGRTGNLNVISDDEDDNEEEEEEEEENKEEEHEEEDDMPNRDLVVNTVLLERKSTPNHVPSRSSSPPSPPVTPVAPPGPPQPGDNKDADDDDGGEDEDETWEGVWRRAFRRVLEKHYS